LYKRVADKDIEEYPFIIHKLSGQATV